MLTRGPKARSISSADTNNANILYAAFWEVYRTPYKSRKRRTRQRDLSTDGGETWKDLTHQPACRAAFRTNRRHRLAREF